MANIPSLNVNAIGEGLKDQNNYEVILDILQRYRKELNFYLMNLDLDNMPAVAENIDWINQSIDGVVISVGNNAGDIAALVVKADAISATVGNNTGDIAALVVTAQGIQSQVTDNKSSITTVTQTAAGIQTQVTNLKTDTESSINQLSDSIELKVTSGDVKNMLNVNTSGVQITASNIDLTGITTIYGNDGYTRMGGTGLSIVSPFGNAFKINWDTYIAYELGSGVTTKFPDVVWFQGPVGFESSGEVTFYGDVDFSYANVTGLDANDVITSYHSNGWCYLDYDSATGIIEVRNRKGTYIGDLTPS